MIEQRIFIYPKTPRSGLCNQLFTWARALVFAQEHGCRLLSPSFSHIKVGPLIRRERDLRLYANHFHADKFTQVYGFRRFLALRLAPRKEMTAWLCHAENRAVFNFREVDPYFVGLSCYQEAIKTSLLRMTRPRWLQAADKISRFDVVMHIRFGDFSNHCRHTLERYISAVKFISSIKADAQVAVFSDARESELAPLLELNNIMLARTGSAISDLIALSRSKFLVGTGSSSFSAWVAFLGQMPSMTRVDNPFSWCGLENKTGFFIGEWNCDNPNPQLLQCIEQI